MCELVQYSVMDGYCIPQLRISYLVLAAKRLFGEDTTWSKRNPTEHQCESGEAVAIRL